LITAPQQKVNLFTVLKNKLFGNNAVDTNQTWHCLTCGRESKQPAEINSEAMEDVT